MKLTINEIADLAQVAKSTVSKALNGQKGVSDEKRKLILDLAEKMNYEPSASAQALSSSKTGTIGLLIPHEAGYSLAGAYWSAIITSIAEIANRNNYSLLILTPLSDDDVFAPVESVIRRRNVDGLIIGAEQLPADLTSRLIEEEIPFVFIGRNPQVQHYSVDVDNAGGSERLVTYLVEQGYKKIACLAGPRAYLYSQEREEGYFAALKKAGIDWSVVENTVYTTEATRCATAKILEDHPDLDALYVTAGGDFIFDCIDILRVAGINLKKFGLGAFDDYRFFDYVELPISTVRQPLKEIGSTAASLLFTFLSGKTPDHMNHILDVELVTR